MNRKLDIRRKASDFPTKNHVTFHDGKPVLCQSKDSIPIYGTLGRLVDLLVEQPLSLYSQIFHYILDIVSVPDLLFTVVDCFLFYSKSIKFPDMMIKVHRLLQSLKSIIDLYPTEFDASSMEVYYSLLRIVEPYFGPHYGLGLHTTYPEMVIEPCSLHQHLLPQIFLKNILEFDVQVLAMQMTLIDFYYFKNIKLSEFLLFNQTLNTKHDGHSTSTISSNVSSNVLSTLTIWESKPLEILTERFNLLSQWTVSLILSTKNKQECTEMIEKMILLASKLMQQCNFHSSLSMVTGLCNSYVLRLKNCWELVSANAKIQLEQLEVLFSSCNNFELYRKTIKNCTKAIPVVMILCKDVYQVQTFVPKMQHKLVNFERCRKLHSILQPILLFQEQLFEFDDNRLVDPTKLGTHEWFLNLLHLQLLDESVIDINSDRLFCT